jgi:hypothetical protein
MSRNTSRSFFSGIRQKLFRRRIEQEIFDRIMPHLQRENNHGYPFNSDAEMRAQTQLLDPQPRLDIIERHIHNMPKAYREAFRHVMHRDLYERFCMYEDVARRHVRRSCNSRLVATRLVPSR